MILGNVPAGTCEGGTLRISSVTTLRLREYPNLCYVALETDDGLTGIGETFFGARAVAAWVHETAAAYLLGKDPRADPTALPCPRGLRRLRRHRDGEPRPLRRRHCLVGSAWPAHRAPALPVAGGLARESVPIYNTCAGPTYVRELPESPDLPVSNWSSGRQSPTDAGQVHSGRSNLNGPAPTPGRWPRTCSPKGSRR